VTQNANLIPEGSAGVRALSPEAVRPPVHLPIWRIRLQLFWRSFMKSLAIFAENKVGLLGIAIILFYALMAVAYPILMSCCWDARVYNPVTGYDFTSIQQPAPPSSAHPLGTDPLGRDILSQLMFSTASEFALGVTAAMVTVLLATTIGAISAYFGGVVDIVFMRIADIVIMVPFVTILIVLSALFDVGMLELAIVIGLLSGFGAAAVVIKSQALTIKVRTYIEAARVAGGNDFHIIFRHIIPNLMPLAFLYMMFTVTGAIFSEAALSYFGLLNIRMSWGLMIHTTENAGYLLDVSKWWLIFPASLSITLLCAAFYLVGRALDEVINPRLRKR
jgi:peptide/nickel transport system permease protein